MEKIKIITEDEIEKKVAEIKNFFEKAKTTDEIYDYLDQNNIIYDFGDDEETDDYLYHVWQITIVTDSGNYFEIETKHRILKQREDDEPIVSKKIEMVQILKEIDE